jgi:hypothetical protein
MGNGGEDTGENPFSIVCCSLEEPQQLERFQDHEEQRHTAVYELFGPAWRAQRIVVVLRKLRFLVRAEIADWVPGFT